MGEGFTTLILWIRGVRSGDVTSDGLEKGWTQTPVEERHLTQDVQVVYSKAIKSK